VKPKIPELDQKGLRKFAWVFAAMIAGIFGIIFPVLFNHNWPVVWPIVFIFFAWGLIAPRTLKPFYYLWMRFGFITNSITTPIILGLVFYVVIVPFAVVFRMSGKDAMHRKWNHELHSYRLTSARMSGMQMEKPF